MAFPHDGVKFEPGQSGNPAGKPPGIPNTRTRLMRWLLLEMTEINPATGKKEKATIIEKMDAAIIKKALKGDLAAYKEIIDRLEGGITEQQTVTVEYIETPLPKQDNTQEQ